MGPQWNRRGAVLLLALLIGSLPIAGAQAGTAPAAVATTVGAHSWRDSLQSVVLTDQLDDSDNPANNLRTVAVAELRTVFVVSTWRSPLAPAVEVVKVLDPAGSLLDQAPARPFATDGTWYDRFYLPMKQAGDYQFQVYANDNLVTTVVLTVVDPAAGISTSHAAVTGDAGVSPVVLQQVARTFEQVAYPLVTADLGAVKSPPVRIQVCSDDSAYRSGLLGLDVSPADADDAVKTSNGIFRKNTMLINLRLTRSLPNVLAHEYTHYVLFRQNITGLPLWVNEGLAWREGLRAEGMSSMNLHVARRRSRMVRRVLKALDSGKLQPLTDNGTGADTPPTAYDGEEQDWMAMTYLEQQYGLQKIQAYVAQLRTADHTSAFTATFSQTPAAFEQAFNSYLQGLQARPAPGAQVTVRIAGGDTGTLFVTAPGSNHEARILIGSPGDYTITMTAGGQVRVEPTLDVAYTARLKAADTSWLTVSFVPDHPPTVSGGKLAEAGFAIKVADGEVYYNNSYQWIGDNRQTGDLLSLPFGLRLLDVQPLAS